MCCAQSLASVGLPHAKLRHALSDPAIFFRLQFSNEKIEYKAEGDAMISSHRVSMHEKLPDPSIG